MSPRVILLGKFFVWDTRLFDGNTVLKGCYICIYICIHSLCLAVSYCFICLFVVLFCSRCQMCFQFRESVLPVHNRVLLFYLFVLFCFVPGCFVQDWCVLQFRGDVKVARVAVATLILSFRGRTMNKCIERGKLKVNKPINNVGPVKQTNKQSHKKLCWSCQFGKWINIREENSLEMRNYIVFGQLRNYISPRLSLQVEKLFLTMIIWARQR